MCWRPKNSPSSPAELCHQLHDSTLLNNLLFCEGRYPSRTHHKRNIGQPSLAKDFAVAEGQEVDDGSGIFLLLLQVGFAGLEWQEGKEFVGVDGWLPASRLFEVEFL